MVLEEIDGILCKEDCEKILFAVNPNSKLIKYKLDKYSEKVVGFMAEHFLLTIIFSNGTEEKPEHRQSFFVKVVPWQNKNQRDYVNSMGIFKKEILMYKNLISEFLKLASKPFAPKYYFSKSDECIVIEDVAFHKYQVCNMEYLDYGKTRGVLETLSRFHAASIIFEEHRGNNGKPYRINTHFPEEVSEATYSFTSGHKRNMWCESTANCVVNLSKFFTGDSNVSEKLRKYIFSDEGLKKFLRPSDKYRNVVCHDDLWRNNLMFKENNDCILIDFQLTRYTPPAFDILLFLYTNLERVFLESNLRSFLDIYYSSLNNELVLHNINTEEILSKTEFLNSIDDYTVPGLVETCMYATHTFVPEKISNMIVSDMNIFEEFSFKNRSPFVVKEFESNEHFKKRISNVLKPLFDIFEKMYMKFETGITKSI